MNFKFVQGDWRMKTLARHEHALKGGSWQIAHSAWVSQTCRKWIPDGSMFAIATGGQIGRRLGITKVTIIPQISIKGEARNRRFDFGIFLEKSQQQPDRGNSRNLQCDFFEAGDIGQLKHIFERNVQLCTTPSCEFNPEIFDYRRGKSRLYSRP